MCIIVCWAYMSKCNVYVYLNGNGGNIYGYICKCLHIMCACICLYLSILCSCKHLHVLYLCECA